MPDNGLNPICAFAISIDGVVQPISLPAKLQSLAKPEGYIWLHFDVGDPAFEAWLTRQLPMTVVKALIETETRPRCDRVENGLVLNLRGVNMNPGADAGDMVSVRLWVTEGLIISARVRKVGAVDAIRQQMDAGLGPSTVTAYLAELAHGLTTRIGKVPLALVEDTDAFEEHVLLPSTTLASKLAALRQSVIKLRRFVRPQSEAISELAVVRFGHWSLTLPAACLRQPTKPFEQWKSLKRQRTVCGRCRITLICCTCLPLVATAMYCQSSPRSSFHLVS